MEFDSVSSWLQLDRASHVPLAQQLVVALADEIRRGRLPPGRRLPGTRTLARQLGVHRNTVVAAFDELVAQGWLETTPASHTRVTVSLPIADRSSSTGRARALGFDVKPWKNSARSFVATPPGVLDFTGGLPDARLFPAEIYARAFRRSLRQSGGDLLAFGNPAGDSRLREGIAALLGRSRGLSVSANDLILTRGSQFALHLLSLALIEPGDIVAVEDPGYPSAREAFTLAGATLLPIPVDREGVDVEVLGRKIQRQSIRAVYVTPHHQDPTTVTLSARRRLELLRLAQKHRFAVIEADYDYEFHFAGSPVLPMASDDDGGVVVYVGTLSKALAPGLRIGFVVAAKPLREALLAVRGQVDRQGDHAVERAVAELLEDGDVVRHSLRARRVFHARRDRLVALLRAELSGDLDFDVPRGGLALWARTSPGIDVDAWSRRCLQAGARFFPGRLYDARGAALPNLRLGFGHLSDDELDQAATILARSLRDSR